MERQEVLPRDAIPSIDDPSFARSYFGGEFLTAFEAPGFDFERRDDRLWGDGTWWDERTGRSDDGRRLTPLPSRHLYAFAWQDDQSPDSFYGLDSVG